MVIGRAGENGPMALVLREAQEIMGVMQRGPL